MSLTPRADSSNHFVTNAKKFPQVFHLNRSDPPITQSLCPVLSDSLIPLATAATLHTLYLPLCILLISREHRSVTSFLPASLFIFSAHIFATLTPLSLSVSFFPLYLSLSSLTLSPHWVIDLCGSHLALRSPLFFLNSSISLSFPCLTFLICFLPLPRVR